MKKRIVLKRLSASDLTLFEHHFRNTSGAKQKAFNLDSAVFIDILYPGLPDRMDITRDRIPLDLSIFGPGKSGLHNLQRKILKQQKNWRLDGELIYDPTEENNRYTPLQKGDYAIIEFSGNSEPNAARMYLIASSLAEDAVLHEALNRQYGADFSSRKGMKEISPEDLSILIMNLGLEEGHPVLDLAGADALEDAVLGGIEGVQQLKKRRKARGVGRDEFERARRSAEQTGRLGEEILKAWLDEEMRQGKLSDFIWDSDDNAISPFDFSIIEDGIVVRKIDAKSTAGDFKNPIHISLAELLEMADDLVPYDIYRLYSIKPELARMRIASNVNIFAKGVLEVVNLLPEGVRVDGISIDPNKLSFDDEIIIDLSSPSENEQSGTSDD